MRSLGENVIWYDDDFPSKTCFLLWPWYKEGMLMRITCRLQCYIHVRTWTNTQADRYTTDLCARLHLSSSEPSPAGNLSTLISTLPHSPLPWQAKAYSTLLTLKPCISCSMVFYTPSTFYKVAHCHAVMTSYPRAITKLSLCWITDSKARHLKAPKRWNRGWNEWTLKHSRDKQATGC